MLKHYSEMIRSNQPMHDLDQNIHTSMFPQKALHPNRLDQSVVLQNFAHRLCQGLQGQLFVKADIQRISKLSLRDCLTF